MPRKLRLSKARRATAIRPSILEWLESGDADLLVADNGFLLVSLGHKRRDLSAAYAAGDVDALAAILAAQPYSHNFFVG